MSPTYCPKTVLLSEVSLPSVGSARVAFPDFDGTVKTLRLLDLLAARPASLRFLRSAVPGKHAAGFVSPDTTACQQASDLGYVGRFPRAACSDMETTRSLKLPGDLDRLSAQVPADPGGPTGACQYRVARAAPAMTTTQAPTIALSRLHHTASALAVYASQ